jgi:hypothetical protein
MCQLRPLTATVAVLYQDAASGLSRKDAGHQSSAPFSASLRTLRLIVNVQVGIPEFLYGRKHLLDCSSVLGRIVTDSMSVPSALTEVA